MSALPFHQCPCTPIACPGKLVGQNCKYPGVCNNLPNTACQPFTPANGWGWILGPMNGGASAAAPDDAAPPLEVAGAALLAGSALACGAGVERASLFALLGAAALAGVLVSGQRLAWWAWAAAAIAAIVCLSGPRGGEALAALNVLTNTI